jgi:2,4-dienoyl-CoA reductase-like NADH-dependent reductase (Old Yellow Enzyme family)
VELHGAHGYLLAQFLSPLSNPRTDAYGGTAAKRAQIVIDVIRAIRVEVPETFTVRIKLNSADVGRSENLEETLEQIDLILKEKVDFLEISGGTYENPRMMHGDAEGKEEENSKPRLLAREAFFLGFAKIVRERFPKTVLMVTGGFRSRKGMVAALENGACDLIGIARPAAAFPHLPKDVLLNDLVDDDKATVQLGKVELPFLMRKVPIKAVGAGVETVSGHSLTAMEIVLD